MRLQESEGSVIPAVIPLSSEQVNENGIYLLENGEDCLIYIGSAADPDTTRQLFGISSIDEIPSQVKILTFLLISFVINCTILVINEIHKKYDK